MASGASGESSSSIGAELKSARVKPFPLGIDREADRHVLKEPVAEMKVISKVPGYLRPLLAIPSA